MSLVYRFLSIIKACREIIPHLGKDKALFAKDRKASFLRESKPKIVTLRTVSVICSTLLVVGLCSCYRNGYRETAESLPCQAIESALKEASDSSLISYSDELPEEWWRIFNDDQLSGLIAMALERNPSLQIAYANIARAKAYACGARAALFPQFTWGADINREKLSETGLIPFRAEGNTPQNAGNAAQGGAGGIPVYFTQYESEINFSYGFDLWGKQRNRVQAALGEVQAAAADAIFTRLQLAISVAEVYFQLQIDHQRREIAQKYVERQKKYLEKVQLRLDANIDDQLSLHEAFLNLTAAQLSLEQIEGLIAIGEHQLQAYVAGSFTGPIETIVIQKRALPSIALPSDLPLHLLAYRPDITAQLWLIQSAGREVEVAKAGFYPDLNLAGFFGYQTIHFEKLLQWKSSFFNVDPAVSLPIFDGGRLTANLRGREVNYNLAILQYNDLLLRAVKEVLDGLTLLRTNERRLRKMNEHLLHQEELSKLTADRVHHNLSSELDLLISEGNLLIAQDQEVMGVGETIRSMLALIQALGGGYHAE